MASFRHMPVVENGKLRRIVGRSANVVKFASPKMEAEDSGRLRDYSPLIGSGRRKMKWADSGDRPKKTPIRPATPLSPEAGAGSPRMMVNKPVGGGLRLGLPYGAAAGDFLGGGGLGRANRRPPLGVERREMVRAGRSSVPPK